MFGFMKKRSEDREERERKKKEEKDQKRTAKSLTAEELARLEEAKRAMKKSAKGGDESAVEGDQQDGTARLNSPSRLGKAGTSDSTKRSSAAPPPVFPKPKKGILKDKSSYGQPVPNQGIRGNVDDSVTLQENTFANENLVGGVEITVTAPSAAAVSVSGGTIESAASPAGSSQKPTGQHRTKPAVSVKRTSSRSGTVASSTPAVAMRPPSPVEKAYDNINLQLPEVAPPSCPIARELTIRRQATGDFGFTLRKGVVLERLGTGDVSEERQRTVIFAEPGVKQPQSSSGGSLLPGDRLIEVNGINVEDSTREAVIDLIRKSGDIVRLKVQTIPELSELSLRSSDQELESAGESVGDNLSTNDGGQRTGALRRSGSMKLRSKLAKTEDELAADKAWMSAERVWLVHRGGFAAAKLLRAGMPGAEGIENLPEGKCRVKVDNGGDILDVDEDAVEKANPPQFDRIEDVATLRNLNESCILHTLRQRYAGNLIHTYAGPALIVINPMHPLSIYTEKVIQMFRGCRSEDMPPHIYAVAQSTYRKLLLNRKDQSIVLTGRSGSGKTTNARHILSYYVTSVGSVNNILTTEKLNAAHMLLDTFGGSRTISNTSTSNFTQVTTLDFDHSGQIVSASIQSLMLEKSRLVRRPEGEPTFHVFYQMLAGIDSSLRKELHLENLTDPNVLMTPLQRAEDRQRATQTWARVRHAMTLLKITDDEVKAICAVLAAIYHIGVAGVAKGANNKYQFSRPAAAQFAADVLGTSPEELSRTVFGNQTAAANQTLSPGFKPASDSGIEVSGLEAVEGFVAGLYAEVFQAIVTLINRSMSCNYRIMASINIVDPSGFRNPASCGRNTGATFEDLCHNYVQERLQLLYHDTVFTAKQDLYSQENIECDFEAATSSPAPMVQLLDMQHSTVVRTAMQDGVDSERRGMLWLLDEEALSPGSSDESFLNLVFQLYGQGGVLLTGGNGPGTFVLNHFQGTNPVLYNVKGWLRSCREAPVTRTVGTFLQESKRDEVSGLFVITSRNTTASTVAGSIVGMVESGASLRRVTSVRRTFTSAAAGVKRRSVGIQIKYQMDSLIDQLRRTNIEFVHCILPQHNAGLCDLRASMTPSTAGDDKQPKTQDDVLLNVPLVRSQIRGAELVYAVRLYRQGFPDHMPFLDFYNRYKILGGPAFTSKPLGPMDDGRQAAEQLLVDLDIDKTAYRMGLSKVFLRCGGLRQLEDMREEKLTGWVIRLQAISRGYLGRRNAHKIKLQHLAVACIQRNIRKLMKIREWPWWRLYTKVKPLLNVHRTEEELKDREYELEQLKAKLEKTERERLEFKLAVDRLETKLTELAADFQDEHTTSNQAGEMLERETVERIRLEKELKELQTKYSSLQQQHQRTEMELIDMRMLATSLENESEDEDVEDVDSALREKYDRARKEAEYTKKKLQHQHEEEIEEYEAVKKQLDRKLAEAVAVSEEQERTIANLKRKIQRSNQEMGDLRLHLEEQLTRNADLEKKQRKFDSELAKVSEAMRLEKQQKEKVQREREEIETQKYIVEQELKTLKRDMDSQYDKIMRLEQEVGATASSDKDDRELVKLRQARNELERKVQDQEEELDDQAGKIQQLEQTKLRLEMAMEKLRQQNAKEIDEKESELENVKANAQKKVRAIEVQLEEAHEDKQKLVRDKRDLERRLQELSEQKPIHDRDVEHSLRRDLRRTKALLQDAQLMLQKNKEASGSRATVKQLQNKLEDAELATAAAVKARKGVEMELQDLQHQLDTVSRAKQEAEERSLQLSREKNELQSHIEENDEEMAEIMKKYKAAVQQHSVDLITFQDQSKQIETLQREKETLHEEVASVQSRLDFLQNNSVDREVVTRLEAKIRDLEAKLDLEQAARNRAETQLGRFKDQCEQESDQQQSLRAGEARALEQVRHMQRQVRDLEEELADLRRKESDHVQRKADVEKRLESLQEEFEQSQADLQLAFKRISDLQAALEDEIAADSDDADNSSDEMDSDNSGEFEYGGNSDSGDDIDESPVRPRKMSIPDDSTA